ncbi:MAG: anhydro-N-acetylmuramic acid kinase [Planctomycetota bacterium]
MVDLARLASELERGEAVVAGVLSGTSGDGIDVVLARPQPGAAPEMLAFETAAFPGAGALEARVRAALDGEPLDARAVALLDRDLGRAFGAAALRLGVEYGIPPKLVASHGQTVWHHDGDEASGAATLQLGDGDEVALAAQAPAVSDFRSKDIAAGGEGAPLSALADGELFAAEARPLAILNIGGMANLTLLGAAGEAQAFDTGPANALLDGLARRLLGRPLDEGGAAAAEGRVDEELVGELLAHPYFGRPLPRSTGRDTFGEAWVESVAARGARLRTEDLLRSAVELVARSVADGLELAQGEPPEAAGRLLVAGGGVHHGPLMAALAARTGLRVATTAEAGIDPDAREALVFAVLGARAVLGHPSTRPEATGARPGVVLGKISTFP